VTAAIDRRILPRAQLRDHVNHSRLNKQARRQIGQLPDRILRGNNITQSDLSPQRMRPHPDKAIWDDAGRVRTMTSATIVGRLHSDGERNQ
jgi:hypothetical protein